MTDGSRLDGSAVPARRPGVDIDALTEPPSSDEYFLYSRIDGDRSVSELSDTSGLGRERTERALEGLVALGLIDLPDTQVGDPAKSSREAATQTTANSEASAASEDDGGIDLSHLPIPPDEFDIGRDAPEVDESLDERHRREVSALHTQLEDLDHYEFFGVDRSAPLEEIKRAYFAYSKRFHPDKFFRRELGRYEQMFEDVFRRVSRAHRVLSDADKREAYDADLDERTGEHATTPVDQVSSNQAGGGEAPGGEAGSAAFAEMIELAEAARTDGDDLEAAEYYQKALRIERDLRPALRAAQVLLRAGEQLERAASFARVALRIDDEHVDSHLYYGRILEALGKTERALESYERVLQLDPENERARRRRAALKV